MKEKHLENRIKSCQPRRKTSEEHFKNLFENTSVITDKSNKKLITN